MVKKMNSVKVKGSTKANRELAFSAVSWYIQKFLPRFRTLDITVKIKNLGDDYCGFCDHEGHNEFTIDINRDMNEFEMTATIMHEMIHVKQFVRKELTECLRTGRQRWKSRWFSYETEYENQPWEKEAHKYDEKLAKEFLKEK